MSPNGVGGGPGTRVVLAAMLLLGVAGAARAGALAGPVIAAVDWDAVRYRPGQQPVMTVTLKPGGFAGTVSASLFDADGRALPPPSPPSMAGDKATFRFRVPAREGRGYHVAIEARNGAGRTVDAASGAFDVADDWSRFPRYCFVTGSSVAAGEDVDAVVENLGSYRCNAIQWYDVNWKHQEPYSPDPSWPNLANQRIDRAVLAEGLARAHALGMVSFDYQLWNGAWSGYATDGSGASPDWGLYRHACAPHCTEAEQVGHGPLPAGWASRMLEQMNAADPRWRAYWIRGEAQVLDHRAFDGVQIDSLGDPGRVTDAEGHPVDLSRVTGTFTAAAAAQLRRRVVFNAVSQWGLGDLLATGVGDVVYTELHPEFGDTPFLPGINGLAATIRARTSKQIVVAAYDETGLALRSGCHTTGGPRVCGFESTGVRILDAQIMASGLDHWELGDLNRACPVRQAKLASNIYVPGPALCMDAALQEWEQDAHNFAVSYETLLRDGAVDAPELRVELSGLPAGVAASRVGAAGGVYVLPKRRGRTVVLHLLNFSELSSNRIDDRNGTDPPVRPLSRLTLAVDAGTAGAGGRPRLWWASPDVGHGRPQGLSFVRRGRMLVFTLPELDVWDMVVLQ